jgi:hypothetical protein
MSRASRGRFEVPGSESEVGGKAGFMAAFGVLDVPLVWVAGCCDEGAGGCGCCVGGLSVAAFAVAGGVEMPFCIVSGAGEAMVGGLRWVARAMGWVVEEARW